MIVYNAETLAYSEKAITLWESKGYTYKAGSWNEIDDRSSFPGVEVLIVRLARKVDSSILDRFPDLNTVCSATTGTDHIDLEELKKRGVRLVCLKGHDEFLASIPSTAEHTWALIMALARKIPAADSHVAKGGWNRDLFRGIQLKDKAIGIIGLGRTGKKVASYARAFDMNVSYYDPFVDNAEYNRFGTLTDLLSSSDIITLHVHMSDATEYLINAENISSVKKGALMVNTSRGRIWDEAAVVWALEHDIPGGVAADVLSTELESIGCSTLWEAKKRFQNIIITPHIGGATYDAMKNCEEFITSLI